MEAGPARRAVAAAASTASALGLAVDDALVLNSSNKLTLRLLPCDVVARVARVGDECADLEIELERGLVASGSPVGELEPRVGRRRCERDGFVMTFWTYYPPVAPGDVPPADYAAALGRLHAGMRAVDVPTPHFTDRVDSARRLVASTVDTPALAGADRELLAGTLAALRQAVTDRSSAEQLLHGEPHPGNVLSTGRGPLFIDLETCCRGPVEFDLAHAPEPVGEHYPGVDRDLLRDCRMLVLAMITTWRWDRGDQLPDGPRLGTLWLSRLRAALEE